MLWVVESSDVELDASRTREAIRVPSVESTSGLCKEFRQLNPINNPTHHYINAPRSSIYIIIPLSRR